MSDSVDPERLPRKYKPADVEVRTRDQPVFVAHATVNEKGWLYTVDWEGSRVYFPPHQVVRVDRHDTETYDVAEEEDVYEQGHRLADPDLREFAAARDQPDRSREAPADD